MVLHSVGEDPFDETQAAVIKSLFKWLATRWTRKDKEIIKSILFVDPDKSLQQENFVFISPDSSDS